MTEELSPEALRLLARLRDRESIEALAPAILNLAVGQRRAFAAEATRLVEDELNQMDDDRVRRALTTWTWLRHEVIEVGK